VFKICAVHIVCTVCTLCTKCTVRSIPTICTILPSLLRPHISATLKQLNPPTDNRHDRFTYFDTVSSSIHRLSGHRQWQCAACSTVDVVRASVSCSAQTGRTSDKWRIVRRYVVFTVSKMLLRLPNKGKYDGQGLLQVWLIGEIHRMIWRGILWEIVVLEAQGFMESTAYKMLLRLPNQEK